MNKSELENKLKNKDLGGIYSGDALIENVELIYGTDTMESRQAASAMARKAKDLGKTIDGGLARIEQEAKRKGLSVEYEFDDKTNEIEVILYQSGKSQHLSDADIRQSLPKFKISVGDTKKGFKTGMAATKSLAVHTTGAYQYLTTAVEDTLDSVANRLTRLKRVSSTSDYRRVQSGINFAKKDAEKALIATTSHAIVDQQEFMNEFDDSWGSSSQARQQFLRTNLKVAGILDETINKLDMVRKAREKARKSGNERAESDVSIANRLASMMQTMSLVYQNFGRSSALSYAQAQGFDDKEFADMEKSLGNFLKLSSTVQFNADEALKTRSMSSVGIRHLPFASLGESTRHLQQTENYLKKVARTGRKTSKYEQKSNMRTAQGIKEGFNYNDPESNIMTVAMVDPDAFNKAYKEAYKEVTGSEAAIVPSLYDDMSVMGAEAAKLMKSVRQRTKKLSEKRYKALREKAEATSGFKKLDPQNKEAIENYVASYIARQLFGSGLKDASISQNANGQYDISANQYVELKGAGKTIGGLTGYRTSSEVVDEKIWKAALKKLNLDERTAQIRSSKEIKTKDLSGILRGVLSKYISDKGAGEAYKVLSGTNSPFKDIIKFDNNGLYFDETADNMQNLSSQKIIEFFASNGIGFKKSGDDYVPIDGYLQLNDILNLPDIFEWTQRVKVGERERSAVGRTIASVSASANKPLENLKKELADRYDPSKGQHAVIYEEAAKAKEEIDKALVKTVDEGLTKADVAQKVKESYKSGVQGRDDKSLITIGRGSQYTIDLNKYKDLQLEYEEGHLTKEEYEKTIWSDISKIKEEIAAKSGKSLTDIDTLVDLGKETGFSIYGRQATTSGMYLPGVAGRKRVDEDTGEEYYDLPIGASDLNALINSIGSRGDLTSEKALTYYLTNLEAIQSGSIYEDLNQKRLGQSASLKTVGTDPLQISAGDLTDKQKEDLVSSVYVSEETLRDMLNDTYDFYNEGDANGDSDARKRYEEGKKRYIGALRAAVKRFDGGWDEKFSTEEEEIEALKNKIIENAKSGKGIIGLSNRFPSISGQDVGAMNVYVDDKLKGSGSVRLGAGLAKLMNADFDGDTVNIALGMFSEGATEEAEELLKNTTDVSKEVYNMIVATESGIEGSSGGKKQTIIKGSTIEEAGNTWMTSLSAIAAKVNKPFVGQFSNMSTKLRNALTERKLDELSLNDQSTDQDRENAAMSIMARAFGQVLEQDAISSKKVEDRIRKKYGDGASSKTITEEQKNAITAEILTDYQNLVDKVYSGDSTFEEFLDEAENLGIFDFGNGNLDNAKQSLAMKTAVARIKQLGLSKEQLEKLGFTEDALEKGNISKKQLIAANEFVENNIGDVGGRKGILGVFYSREFLDTKNDVYGLVRYLEELGVQFQDLKDPIDGLARVFDELGRKIKDAGSELSNEMGVEKAKIVVAGKQAAGINALTESFDKMAKAEENASSGTFKINKNVTGALQEQFGEGNVDYSGQNKTINDYLNGVVHTRDGKEYVLKDGQWVDSSTNQAVTDKNKLAEIGRMGYSEKEFSELSKHYYQNERGNIAHGVSELLLATGKGSFNDVDKEKLSDDLKKKYDELKDTIDKYKNGLSKIGINEEDINSRVGNAIKIGEAYRTVVTGLGLSGDNVLSEQKLNLTRQNDVLHGRTDVIGMSGEGSDAILQLLDYKTRTGKGGTVSGKEVAQVITYVTSTQELLKQLMTGDFSSAEEFNESAIGKKLGYTQDEQYDNRLSQEMYELLMKYIKEVLGDNFKSASDYAKERVLNNVHGSIIEGSGTGARRYQIGNGLLKVLANDPETAGILEKVISSGGDISEEDSKILESKLRSTTGVLDKAGDLSGTNEAKESSPKQEEERRKRIVDLFKEQLKIQKEIKKIDEEKSKYSGEDLKKLEDYEAILRQDLKNVEEELDSEKDTEEYKRLKTQKDVADVYASGQGREIALSSFKKMLKERAKLENEIYGYQLKSNLAVTDRERSSYQTMILHKKRDIESLNNGVNGQPGINFFMQNYAGDQGFADAFSQYNLLLAELNDKTLAAHKGQTTFWDALTRDIKRSVVALNNFNIAHKVIQKIPQDIKKVINITKQLDSILTNLAIVTGSSTKENEKYLDSYIDLANQLGVTTTQVAQATTEWLRQGYSVQESQKLVTASIQLSKLGMIDASTATRDLTKWIRYIVMYRKI